MQDKVSVIIPCYNHAGGLSAAIHSVRDQSWPNVEIIVVDDGSTDQTQSLLRELNGSDLQILRQQNQGPAAARNAGIQAAQGDWIAFLDADDYWLPGKLATQFELLASHPEAGFSYGGVRLRTGAENEREVRCDFNDRSLLLVLLEGNRLFTPTVVVRRDCLQETGLFHTGLRTGEDWDLWLRLAARHSSVGDARPLAVVERRAGTTTYRLRLLEKCTLTVLERLFSCPETQALWPQLQAQQERVYAWQYSVLARSYARKGDLFNCVRLGLKAVMSDRAGLSYVLPRSRAPIFEGGADGTARVVTAEPG
jgi:glycosyltransferase involved in cell wall biosynthesis